MIRFDRRVAVQRDRRASAGVQGRPRSDAGFSLTELLIVIAVSTLVLGMVFTVVAAFARNDARNLVRQSRVDEVRRVGLWLGDALTYAESPVPAEGAAAPVAVFDVAEAQKMVFTSALNAGLTAEKDALSRVTIILGEDCEGAADPGVLRRCVSHPYDDAEGAQQYCAADSGTCPDGAFENTVMARGVKDQALFAYFLEADTSPAGALQEVADPALRATIAAVEFKVTVTGPEGGDTTESTVYKRYTISEWRSW
ncbi:MAG: prepilin-type N-terminal cleavage/methylation domain-containing protein [Bifidobacteriaceae bacterium]|jgi:prepilin-type N-terminal cleavage/methylation domain-containing protein|nr:prepilin-type N-terminal cleavage/methylation domain-containing protein [Bifidobacteriaceae bacterium]